MSRNRTLRSAVIKTVCAYAKCHQSIIKFTINSPNNQIDSLCLNSRLCPHRFWSEKISRHWQLYYRCTPSPWSPVPAPGLAPPAWLTEGDGEPRRGGEISSQLGSDVSCHHSHSLHVSVHPTCVQLFACHSSSYLHTLIVSRGCEFCSLAAWWRSQQQSPCDTLPTFHVPTWLLLSHGERYVDKCVDIDSREAPRWQIRVQILKCCKAMQKDPFLIRVLTDEFPRQMELRKRQLRQDQCQGCCHQVPVSPHLMQTCKRYLTMEWTLLFVENAYYSAFTI